MRLEGKNFKNGSNTQFSRLVLAPEADDATPGFNVGTRVFVAKNFHRVAQQGVVRYKKKHTAAKTVEHRLFGVSRGRGVGLPNLLGVTREGPKQDLGELGRAIRSYWIFAAIWYAVLIFTVIKTVPRRR
jgi:hypothetical protein